jgi:uncharacterized protein (DUF2164 family)
MAWNHIDKGMAAMRTIDLIDGPVGDYGPNRGLKDTVSFTPPERPRQPIDLTVFN